MKLPNYALAAWLFLFVSAMSVAQNKGTIKGSVTSNDGNQLGGILITLLQSDGTTIAKTNLSESDGSFSFEELPFSSYFVSITVNEFENFISSSVLLSEQNPIVQLPKITLKKNEAIQLNEVKIDKKIPFVVQKVDKTIVNPDALISNAGGNALDVLSKSPGVSVDENGNVKLRGKSGVTIFIDDKPTYLTGTELESYLKSLPSNAIKQVEIMTNPPAKYEASGNGGIINIVTKRSKLKGFNGNASLNYGQGKYARTMDNVNLNYNAPKFAIFSNLSYTNAETYHDLTIERRFKNPDLSPQSSFEQNTYLKSSRQSYNGRLGFDYYLSEKSTIGIVAKGLINTNESPRYNYATVRDAIGTINQIVTADNFEKVDFKNGTITLNYRQQFTKPEQLLTTDFDYVTYSSTIDQLYKNAVVDLVGPNSSNDIQNGYLPSTINIYALKSDYTTPLKNDSKLDFGAKVSWTKTDNDAVYTKTTQANGTQPNYDLSNHFFYDEVISAAYVNYTQSFKKIDIQAGLRFEDTELKGKQLGNPIKPYSEFKNNYNSLFPTAYVSYKIDSLATKTINLSYGKRVERPFYKDLNPFSSPLDQFTYYEGNPFLKPTFGHNFSLTYNYTELLSTSFSYSYGKDEIKETIEIVDGIYYSRPNNIGKSNQYILSVQSRFNPAKWLTTIVYSEVNYSRFKSQLYDQTLDSKGTYWFINATNSIQFSKKWSGEIIGQYLSESVDAQFTIGDFGFVSIGCQKKILNDLGTLKFNLSDVFFTNQIRGRINNLGTTEANWFGPRDTRILSVTFSYRFGKNTSNKTKYNGTGSESEQNRVKV
ncbi:TonB-dependent receptor [Flavobacterium sp.]|uniref:TonB-dependent receptor n=1 Tax=Flavobacterium sp. TaxID=239 RepID=UPI002B4B333F|nr:TonB-dependent receptor [Flavobacterium sp.]HLP63875.1 TonB-dependent receptor [Flavobacterium sp.]